MKRFSKMVSVMTEVPAACVSNAIICACRSVGKPGYGQRAQLDRPERRAARNPQSVGDRLDLDARLAQLGDDRVEMLDRRIREP